MGKPTIVKMPTKKLPNVKPAPADVRLLEKRKQSRRIR